MESLGLTWITLEVYLDSLDHLVRTWTHFDPLDLTRARSDPLDPTWSHVMAYGFVGTRLISLQFVWTPFDPLVLTRTRFDSLDLIWFDPHSLGLTVSYLDSLGLSWTYFASLDQVSLNEIK